MLLLVVRSLPLPRRPLQVNILEQLPSLHYVLALIPTPPSPHIFQTHSDPLCVAGMRADLKRKNWPKVSACYYLPPSCVSNKSKLSCRFNISKPLRFITLLTYSLNSSLNYLFSTLLTYLILCLPTYFLTHILTFSLTYVLILLT